MTTCQNCGEGFAGTFLLLPDADDVKELCLGCSLSLVRKWHDKRGKKGKLRALIVKAKKEY